MSWHQYRAHHHHISIMELGHLLTRSGLTYSEVSSKVCHDSFYQLWNSVSLPCVNYYGAFYLHVVSSFSYITVIFLKLVLFLIPLQFVHLFCNQSKCSQFTTINITLFCFFFFVPVAFIAFFVKFCSGCLPILDCNSNLEFIQNIFLDFCKTLLFSYSIVMHPLTVS